MTKSRERSGFLKSFFEFSDETKRNLGHVALGAVIGAGIILSI